MSNNIGLTFSVGDTIPWFTIRARELELVTLNIIFSVVEFEKYRFKFKDFRKITDQFRGICRYTLYSKEKPKDHNKSPVGLWKH